MITQFLIRNWIYILTLFFTIVSTSAIIAVNLLFKIKDAVEDTATATHYTYLALTEEEEAEGEN